MTARTCPSYDYVYKSDHAFGYEDQVRGRVRPRYKLDYEFKSGYVLEVRGRVRRRVRASTDESRCEYDDCSYLYFGTIMCTRTTTRLDVRTRYKVEYGSNASWSTSANPGTYSRYEDEYVDGYDQVLV